MFIRIPRGLVDTVRVLRQLLRRVADALAVAVVGANRPLAGNTIIIGHAFANSVGSVTNTPIRAFHHWMDIVCLLNVAKPRHASAVQTVQYQISMTKSQLINSTQQSSIYLYMNLGQVRLEQSVAVQAGVPSGLLKHLHTSYGSHEPCPEHELGQTAKVNDRFENRQRNAAILDSCCSNL